MLDHGFSCSKEKNWCEGIAYLTIFCSSITPLADMAFHVHDFIIPWPAYEV